MMQSIKQGMAEGWKHEWDMMRRHWLAVIVVTVLMVITAGQLGSPLLPLALGVFTSFFYSYGRDDERDLFEEKA